MNKIFPKSFGQRIVIFDLDGTLALIDKRRKISGASNPAKKINWKIFLDPKNILLDEPNWPVMTLFQTFKYLGYIMIIFSGRDSITETATKKWLEKYGIEYDHLLLRPLQNIIPDEILKQNWLNDIEKLTGLTKSDIYCVFDDRSKVVKMWRDNGLTCFQVADGDF